MNSRSQRKSLESIETYLANLPVVTLRGFLEEVLVLGHLLLVRERDTVDTLQRVVLRVSEEVGRGALRSGFERCHEQEREIRTFVTMNDLILPVCGM